jgi:MYXO-CTERM domain-containing protein
MHFLILSLLSCVNGDHSITAHTLVHPVLGQRPPRELRWVDGVLRSRLRQADADLQIGPDGVSLGRNRPGIRLTGWGSDEGTMEPLADGQADLAPCDDLGLPCDNLARIDHGEVSSWWAPFDNGVEWGWTVDAPPVTAGTLRLETTIEGMDWTSESGGVDQGGRLWFLGEVMAWDAHGAELDTWVWREGDRIIVEVDTTGANGAITVDPSLYSPDEVIVPPTPLQYYGGAAGDVNGDGYADVWVQGNYQYTSDNKGRVYVFHGGSAGLDNSPTTTLVAQYKSDDSFGGNAAPPSDFNNDGFDDLALGDYGYDVSQTTYVAKGAVFVFNGSASGISSVAASSLYGSSTVSNMGYFVSSGDFNGDGYADISASFRSGGYDYAGVYMGASSGVSTSAAATVQTSYATRVGDIDGDSFDDLIISDALYSSSAGRILTYYGSLSGVSTTSSTTVFTGSASGQSALAQSIGDVDGDGLAEIFAVVLSNPTSSYYLNSILLGDSARGVLTAGTTFSFYANQLSYMGDFNGDGLGDAGLGLSPPYTSNFGVLYFGDPASLMSPTPSLTLAGATLFVVPLGDINADGFDEIGTLPYLYFGFTDDDNDGYIVGGDLGTTQDCDDADPVVNVKVVRFLDADGDGFGGPSSSLACPGDTTYSDTSDDCDDSRADVNPGMTEVCDAANADEDCDGLADDADSDAILTTWYRDADADGAGNPARTTDSCEAPWGYVAAGDDCDDSEAQAFPGNTEVCDGVDNDCSGAVDEGLRNTYYRDTDGDGHGDPSRTTTDCEAPLDYVEVGDDCDDDEFFVHPGRTEVCDGLDNDCSGGVDEGLAVTYFRDDDGDGHGDAAHSATECEAPPGYVTSSDDCDDDEVNAYPGATEACDGLDNDCSGEVDDGLGQTWYKDADGDGHGDPSRTVTACEPPLDYVSTSDDCDDGAKGNFPGAEERCDEVDNNCNTSIDEDVDCPSDDDLAIAENYPPKSGCSTTGGSASWFGAVGAAALLVRRRRYSR